MSPHGLVTRMASPEDGRGAYVTITAAGRRAIEEAAPAHVELVRRLLFDGLSATQVRTLASVALAVVERLDDRPE